MSTRVWENERREDSFTQKISKIYELILIILFIIKVCIFFIFLHFSFSLPLMQICDLSSLFSPMFRYFINKISINASFHLPISLAIKKPKWRPLGCFSHHSSWNSVPWLWSYIFYMENQLGVVTNPSLLGGQCP